MELQKPTNDWFNKELIENILKGYKNDPTVKVKDFKVGGGFTEHFVSELFRCEIDFVSKSGADKLCVVVKSKPLSGAFQDLVENSPIFETEIRMYKEILPAMSGLFERNGMKVDLGPELIYGSMTPFPLIILKDLSYEGFRTVAKPFDDFANTRIVIERIAKMHAASYYLEENNECDIKWFDSSYYNDKDAVNSFLKDTFDAFVEVLATWDGYQQYLPKVEYLRDNLSVVGSEASRRNSPGEGFNVLCHLDLHGHNTLVRYNEQKLLEKLILIDYQTCHYCSPAADFAFLMCFSKQDEEGDTPWEEITKIYHDEFSSALKAFGYLKPIPTLLDLNVELLRHGQLTMVYEIGVLPLAMDNWEEFKLEHLYGDGSEESRSSRRKAFEKPKIQKLLQKRLKTWVMKGWL